MNELEKAIEHFIKMFIKPYKLDEADTNIVIKAFIIGFKTKEVLVKGGIPWMEGKYHD